MTEEDFSAVALRFRFFDTDCLVALFRIDLSDSKTHLSTRRLYSEIIRLSEKSSNNDNYLKFFAFFSFDRHRSCSDLTEALRAFETFALPHLQRT